MAGGGGIPLAGKDSENEPTPINITAFGTLNTKANRPAIADNEFSWIENFMPIGDGNMRTLPGEGATLYTATGGKTVIYKLPFNFGAVSYIAVFLSDGSAIQVKQSDSSTVTIGAAGTFWTTNGDLPTACQWQSKYLLIGSTKTSNSYWVWDGTSLYGSGTLAPQVTITDGGLGYTSQPTITAYGGSGSGATFSATITNQVITQIAMTNPGSGYLDLEHVKLVITGGGSDNQARATAVVSTTSGVAAIQVTVGGSGYSADVHITFSGGGGTGAAAVVSSAVNGVITGITVTSPGSGYTSAPTVAFVATSGTGAAAICQMRRGQITSITVDNGGTGYTGAPQVQIAPPDDLEFPTIQAEATAFVSGGVVTSITVTNPGAGYINAGVELLGGNNAANASVTLMPFGIQATTIETYQNHVWTAVGTKMSYTGPNNVSNFSTVDGGGSAPASESFLRRQITVLKQANGFLYRFADSSINVISNVQTSDTGVTTFNNSNVDPQVGTAWRDSIAAFGRALVFANSSGVYALFGGSAEKVSQPLDGLFAKASFTTKVAGLTPTAATATIYGIRVYAFLFTTTDPYTKTLRNIVCLWDGQKWFASTQVKTPTILSSQEIDSELTAWGTDGTHVYPLYQTATGSLSKVFQTKLSPGRGFFLTKQVNRGYIMVEENAGQPSTVTVTVDTEGPSGQPTTINVNSTLTFIGAGGVPIQFIGSGGANLNFTVTNLFIWGYGESTYGKLIGTTLTTSAVDLTMISLTLLLRDYAPYG